MPLTRPPYPPEFKLEAVGLYRQSGKNLQEIASDLGISTNSLREWVRRAEGDASPNGKSRTSLNQDEREELKRLQRENRVLREEREILKNRSWWHATTQKDENEVRLLTSELVNGLGAVSPMKNRSLAVCRNPGMLP